MVRVINYLLRVSKENKEFIVLELQGDLVMVQSQQTGKFYATAQKCTITSTFDENTAKLMIGKEIPGRIERVQTDPYEYTIQDTGEVIQLSHRYQYLPEETIVERKRIDSEILITT